MEAGALGQGEAERGLPSLELDGCQGSCCCLQILEGREEGKGSQRRTTIGNEHNLEPGKFHLAVLSWMLSAVNRVWVRSPKVTSRLHHSAMSKLEEQSIIFTAQL